jgi:hypothetical protein
MGMQSMDKLLTGKEVSILTNSVTEDCIKLSANTSTICE